MSQPSITVLGHIPGLASSEDLVRALGERAAALRVFEAGGLGRAVAEGDDDLAKSLTGADLILILWSQQTSVVGAQERTLLDLAAEKGMSLPVCHVRVEECTPPLRYARLQMTNLASPDRPSWDRVWSGFVARSEQFARQSSRGAAEGDAPPHEVFISYKREDQAFARRVRDFLVAEGLAVWWDEDLTEGSEFDTQLEAAIDAASVVVVIWTERAIHGGPWVLDEAHRAYSQRKLVSVIAGPCDLPIPYNREEPVSLVGWNPTLKAAPGQLLVKRIRMAQRGEPAPEVEGALRTPASVFATGSEWAGRPVPAPVPEESWSLLQRIEMRQPKRRFREPRTPKMRRWCVVGDEIYMIAEDEIGLGRLHVTSREGAGRRYFARFGADPDGVQDVCEIPLPGSHRANGDRSTDYATVGLRRATAWFFSDRGSMTSLAFEASELRGDGHVSSRSVRDTTTWPFEEVASEHSRGDFYCDLPIGIASPHTRSYLALRVGILEGAGAPSDAWRIRIWRVDALTGDRSFVDFPTESTSGGRFQFSASTRFLTFGHTSSQVLIDVDANASRKLVAEEGWTQFGPVAFHPARDVYAIAAYSRSERPDADSAYRLEIWDPAASTLIFRRELGAATGMTASAWSPDGRVLAMASRDGLSGSTT